VAYGCGAVIVKFTADAVYAARRASSLVACAYSPVLGINGCDSVKEGYSQGCCMHSGNGSKRLPFLFNSPYALMMPKIIRECFA
jgi:hypothetical protein